MKNFDNFVGKAKKIFWGPRFLENLKNCQKKLIKKNFEKTIKSVPCFRIWGHFPPFRVIGFRVVFHRSVL